MKATFALLSNSEVHNFVRKLSWEMHQKYRTGTRHTALPPHISLTSIFDVPSLPALEGYMDELAGSIQPFDVTLTEFQAVPMLVAGVEYGILWAAIEETETLRNLHHRLNRELNQRFETILPDSNGNAYRFHMSIMMCGHLMEIYSKYQNEIPSSKINLRYTARELAMLVYDEPLGLHTDHLCYRVLPMGKTDN